MFPKFSLYERFYFISLSPIAGKKEPNIAGGFASRNPRVGKLIARRVQGFPDFLNHRPISVSRRVYENPWNASQSRWRLGWEQVKESCRCLQPAGLAPDRPESVRGNLLHERLPAAAQSSATTSVIARRVSNRSVQRR